MDFFLSALHIALISPFRLCALMDLSTNSHPRIGRKPVFASSSIGMTLNLVIIMVFGWFPNVLSIQLVWLASLAHICGGAPAMSACIYSILSDIVPESNRYVLTSEISIAEHPPSCLQ